MKQTRQEYPRPQFRRNDWQPLNGEWEFEFDDERTGEKRGLYNGTTPLKAKITVPFSYQYMASGIGKYEKHETLWYKRAFAVDKALKNKRALLCFNASDYVTDVWVNGVHVVTHVGGYTPFYADITDSLRDGENTLVVKCFDPDDPTIPRGKQSWTGDRFTCWYVPNSGIWQSVWLEFFDVDALVAFTIDPDIDTLSFSGEAVTEYGKADALEINVSYKGRHVKSQRISLENRRTRYSVSLSDVDFVDEVTYWTVEYPNLYDVELVLEKDGAPIDRVFTRFGMRKVSVDENGYITLNHRRLYQKLVLDQGYWSESGITPPSAEAIKKDIELAKAMGFNGARKHQKLEDPYFYYLADELGFLTWCEMPSAFDFCAEEVQRLTAEWLDIVGVARAFASVVCYVPLNESWGTRKILTDRKQQDLAAALYYATKAVDPSRLISTNDGWECVQTTDIVGVHDYAPDSSEFDVKYCTDSWDRIYPQGRKLMCIGHSAKGKPVVFTEFGGIAMKGEAVDGKWGYNSEAASADELYARLKNLMKGIKACPFQGYCYTQLTDVQQEVNGLLDENRQPKVDVKKLKKIFDI